MEQIFQQQMGIAPQGQEGGMGGGFGGGGGGGMGGGSLGGGKPKGIGGDQQGNLPGGQSGPGLPGDGIAPSMSGGAPGGAPPGPQAAYETQLTNYNAAQEHAPSISRKSRIQEPKPPRMQVEETPQAEMYTGPRTGAFRLTDIERLLYSEVNKAQRNGNIPLDFQWQINPVPHDPECSKIICDGVFPDIKLAVEADGKQWHAAPDDVVRDQDRDARLARHGWSILRFTEDQIKHYMQDVISTIIKTVEEMTVTSSDKGRKVFASGGYTYKEAEKSIDITDDIEIDPSLKMSEKEEFVVDQAFKQTAKNIGEDLDIEKLKKNAEVISEDLEEIDREDDLEMRDLVKQREELGNLIPEK
jgi:very-short-patch-repair endonuclease